MKLPVLIFAVLACVGQWGCTRPSIDPVTPFNFESPYEGSFLATPMDSGQIRVVSSDFAGVEIGLCADESGGVTGKPCGKDKGIPEWDALKLMSLPSGRLPATATESEARGSSFVCSLSGGTFGQQSRLVSINSAVGASYGPASGKTTLTYARYQLVYEWSRSVNVFAPVNALNSESDPVVSSADYGVALRLLMDVELKSTDAEVGANIGIAQLTAALALQQAMVNVRFVVLGAMTSFLPDKAIRIDSASDLHEVMSDFHNRARELSGAWEQECKRSKEPGSTVGTGSTASTAASTTPSTSVIGILRPVMLAYYVRGHQVGEKLRRIQDAKTRCVELKNRRRALRQKKTLVGDEIDEVETLEVEAGVACTTAEGRGTDAALSAAVSQLKEVRTIPALNRIYWAILDQVWDGAQKSKLEQVRAAREGDLLAPAPAPAVPAVQKK
jgi:hypothetical protein